MHARINKFTYLITLLIQTVIELLGGFCSNYVKLVHYGLYSKNDQLAIAKDFIVANCFTNLGDSQVAWLALTTNA